MSYLGDGPGPGDQTFLLLVMRRTSLLLQSGAGGLERNKAPQLISASPSDQEVTSSSLVGLFESRSRSSGRCSASLLKQTSYDHRGTSCWSGSWFYNPASAGFYWTRTRTLVIKKKGTSGSKMVNFATSRLFFFETFVDFLM